MLNKKIIFILVIFSILVVGPVFAGGDITGDTSNNQSQDFLAWARWIYPFALSMAAVLVVAMIVIAGIQMMIPSPGAKEEIKLSTSKKSKVFEQETERSFEKGDLEGIIASDGTRKCRKCP